MFRSSLIQSCHRRTFHIYLFKRKLLLLQSFGKKIFLLQKSNKSCKNRIAKYLYLCSVYSAVGVASEVQHVQSVVLNE